MIRRQKDDFIPTMISIGLMAIMLVFYFAVHAAYQKGYREGGKAKSDGYNQAIIDRAKAFDTARDMQHEINRLKSELEKP